MRKTDEKGLRSEVGSLWIGIEAENESKQHILKEGLSGVRNGAVVKNLDKWDGYLSRLSMNLGNVTGGMDLGKAKRSLQSGR